VIQHYTAIYRPIETGYMGQLAEWPEVITEGADIAEVRAMLEDALSQMVAAYKELGKEIPPGDGFLEQIAVQV
jgi:predicted RNase H-like HicB family nuclease